jgi:hypothetical protein
MLSTQSFKVDMGMSLKMRTSLRSTKVPGLMPKRVSTPAINSLIKTSSARDWVLSSGVLKLAIGASVLAAGAGVADVAVRTEPTAVRI